MTKLAVAFALLASAGRMAFGDGPPGAFSLKVMTFNVRYGTANDGPNSWEHRKDIVINTIHEAAPDIVGTQECLDFQARYMVDRVPEFDWFGVGRESDGSGEHMAVFYRKSLLEPMERGHFWLSETPDIPGSMSWNTACTRMVTWLRFKHIPSGRTLHYFNTHLDHRSATARSEGARLIVNRLAAVDPGEPVILTGDFNCPGGEAEPWRCLIEAGMKDAWEQAERRAGPASTWCGFEAPRENGGRRIDWILIRGPVQAIEAETLTVNEGGRYPSDHFPVVSVLRSEGGATVNSAPN